MEINLSYIPVRPEKPRNSGLTIINDNGLGLREVENILSSSGKAIDFVRINPSGLISDERLDDKIKIYSSAHIKTFLSGTLFEAAYIRNYHDRFYDFLEKKGLHYIEISDGIIEILPGIKAGIINILKNRFHVISKVGAYKNNALFPYEMWEEYITTGLQAGSEKIIIEGGNAGITNIVNGTKELREPLIQGISKYANQGQLIWEAPVVEHQAWFIKKFGSNVNLAGIEPVNVLNLESLRLGLHADTLLGHIPAETANEHGRAINPVYNFDWQI